MPRDFLVYTPASRGDFAGEFSHPSRLFDLAVNDWTGSGKYSSAAQQAEYKFAEKGHKWPTAARLLPQLPPYKFYAFIDEDIDVSVANLNGLFQTGELFGLSVYQAEPLFPRFHAGPARQLPAPDDVCRDHGAVFQPRRARKVRPDLHHERTGVGTRVCVE
jgi:hypothetical protein